MTDVERIAKLNNAFRPHTPIERSDAFFGRQDELSRVKEAIEVPGLQVVIYGERGAGKTSLANVSTLNQNRVRVFCEEDSSFFL